MIINPAPVPLTPPTNPQPTQLVAENPQLVEPTTQTMNLAQETVSVLTRTRAGRRMLTEALAAAARTSH